MAASIGNLAGAAVVEPVKPDQRQHVLHLGLQPVGAAPCPQPEGHVVKDVHMREQRKVLKDQPDLAVIGGAVGHVLAAHQDAAMGGCFEPCDHAQQGGLATARRPQKGDEFALHDVDAHAADRRGSVKPFGDVINGQDRFGRGVVTGQILGLHDGCMGGCIGDMRGLDHAR